MSSIKRATALKSELEATLLRVSIMATFAIAGIGIVFGLLSNSLSILFDALFSLVDAFITWLMLVVARLVAQESNQRFQYGFWHLEPLAVALKAGVLMTLVVFAFLGASQSIRAGGHHPELGSAILYAVVVLVICVATFIWMWRHNSRIQSQLVSIDLKAWAASSVITAALLLAFVMAHFMQSTRFAPLVPYVDPVTLALLSLAVFPVPLKDASVAMRDIFRIVPKELDQHVRQVMDQFIATHQFERYTSYVTTTGRARFIEICILARQGMPAQTIEALDKLRAEIGFEIGGAGPDRWLTIIFTTDEDEL